MHLRPEFWTRPEPQHPRPRFVTVEQYAALERRAAAAEQEIRELKAMVLAMQ